MSRQVACALCDYTVDPACPDDTVLWCASCIQKEIYAQDEAAGYFEDDDADEQESQK